MDNDTYDRFFIWQCQTRLMFQDLVDVIWGEAERYASAREIWNPVRG